MPTVALNSAKNAGILADQIISFKLEEVREKIIKYKQLLYEVVLEKAKKIKK